MAPNTLMRDPVSLLVPEATGLLPPSSPMRHEAQDLSHYSHCRRPAPFGAVGPGPRGAGIFDYSAFCCLYIYKPSKSETGLLYLYWPNQSGLGPGLPCLFAWCNYRRQTGYLLTLLLETYTSQTKFCNVYQNLNHCAVVIS